MRNGSNCSTGWLGFAFFVMAACSCGDSFNIEEELTTDFIRGRATFRESVVKYECVGRSQDSAQAKMWVNGKLMTGPEDTIGSTIRGVDILTDNDMHLLNRLQSRFQDIAEPVLGGGDKRYHHLQFQVWLIENSRRRYFETVNR